jgi:hypothetical protein
MSGFPKYCGGDTLLSRSPAWEELIQVLDFAKLICDYYHIFSQKEYLILIFEKY